MKGLHPAVLCDALSKEEVKKCASTTIKTNKQQLQNLEPLPAFTRHWRNCVSFYKFLDLHYPSIM